MIKYTSVSDGTLESSLYLSGPEEVITLEYFGKLKHNISSQSVPWEVRFTEQGKIQGK